MPDSLLITALKNSDILAFLVGSIGTITGIVSLIKVHNIESQNLRLERGRISNAIQVGLKDLKDLAPKADKSRVNRFAAQGLSRSGAMEKWKSRIQEINQEIQNFSQEFTNVEQKDCKKSKTIEVQILQLGLLQERIFSTINELKESIAEDDSARERLFRMRFQSTGTQ